MGQFDNTNNIFSDSSQTTSSGTSSGLPSIGDGMNIQTQFFSWFFQPKPKKLEPDYGKY